MYFFCIRIYAKKSIDNLNEKALFILQELEEKQLIHIHKEFIDGLLIFKYNTSYKDQCRNKLYQIMTINYIEFEIIGIK